MTRVGGVGHNKRQKAQAAQTLKLLADFRQAEEFSHFGSELAVEAKRALQIGKYIFEMLTQSPADTYSFMAQQLMLDIILNVADGASLDISALKLNVAEYAVKVTGDDDYDKVRDELKTKCMVELKGATTTPVPASVTTSETANTEEKPAEKSKDGEKPTHEKNYKKKQQSEKEKAGAVK